MNNRFFTIGDSEIRPFAILAATLLVLLAVLLILGTRIEREDLSMPTEVVSKPFPSVALRAKAAYVYDIRAKEVLFAKNGNKILPLASLSKIMSAMVAKDMASSHTIITVSAEALSAEGNNGLYHGEKWSLGNLLDFSLLTSSNDGIRAVALSLGALSRANVDSAEIISDFVSEMNSKATALGLTSTYFLNETGLDIQIEQIENVGGQISEAKFQNGAYGSAKDTALLLEHALIYYPDLLSVTKESITPLYSLDNHTHVAKNTNIISHSIPGLIASKTGFTNIAGGNLAIIMDPELGRPIAVVVLGSTEQGRFEDTRVIIDAVMEYISQ